jgi:hypothetical protein
MVIFKTIKGCQWYLEKMGTIFISHFQNGSLKAGSSGFCVMAMTDTIQLYFSLSVCQYCEKNEAVVKTKMCIKIM